MRTVLQLRGRVDCRAALDDDLCLLTLLLVWLCEREYVRVHGQLLVRGCKVVEGWMVRMMAMSGEVFGVGGTGARMMNSTRKET